MNETNDVNRYLSIYLNDHLAGATVGVELARRLAARSSRTPHGCSRSSAG